MSAPCDRTDEVAAYLLGTLSRDERREMDAHLASCAACRQEQEYLRPVVESLVAWPTDVTRTSRDLWDGVAAGLGLGEITPSPSFTEPEWEQVAVGIQCKLLSTDSARNRVSMLVRLAPGAAYPPHVHAGIEELYLLDGELWIEDRKLYPGDYNRGEPGTADQLVWSETGCTCVLITSTHDLIR
jgi:anti-sigma factor ChrR (cupin superfamily)